MPRYRIRRKSKPGLTDELLQNGGKTPQDQNEATSSLTNALKNPSLQTMSPDSVLQMQRTFGNQFTQQLIQQNQIQRKSNTELSDELLENNDKTPKDKSATSLTDTGRNPSPMSPDSVLQMQRRFSNQSTEQLIQRNGKTVTYSSQGTSYGGREQKEHGLSNMSGLFNYQHGQDLKIRHQFDKQFSKGLNTWSLLSDHISDNKEGADSLTEEIFTVYNNQISNFLRRYTHISFKKALKICPTETHSMNYLRSLGLSELPAFLRQNVRKKSDQGDVNKFLKKAAKFEIAF